MAEKFNTSFIPKKTEAPRHKRQSRSLLALIISIVFIISLASAVGVFFYEKLVESSIERKKESLEKAREAFEPSLIEELARLDRRLFTAQSLVDNHLAISTLFDSLNLITVTNLRMTNFTYEG